MDKHMHNLLAANGVPRQLLFHWQDPVRYDAQCSIMSLPAVLKSTMFWDGPYLAAPPDRIEKYKHLRGKIGFCSISSEANPLRRIPDEIAKPFAERNELFDLTPESLGSFDWADTAGAIANLKLIIAVDTGVVHLAGAMGMPTWLLVTKWGEWRWGRTSTTPWYGTIKIFRQTDDEANWNGLLGRVAAAADLPYRKIEPVDFAGLTPKQKFFANFDLKYSRFLRSRAPTFRAVLAALQEDPLIVETGTMHDPTSFGGNGASTLLFDEYCQMFGGRLLSVDIEPRAAAVARPVVSQHTELFTAESICFLQNLKAEITVPIDLLYLDSMDGYLPGADGHQMNEFRAAQPFLRSGSIVFIDDATSKGRLLVPFLDNELKAPRLAESFAAGSDINQIAWRMP
jgi:predicted O-methyltransferase YrrM